MKRPAFIFTILVIALFANILWLFFDWKSWLWFYTIVIILLVLFRLSQKALEAPPGCCKYCQGLGIQENLLTCTVCRGTGEQDEV